jgi:hypothetical protein
MQEDPTHGVQPGPAVLSFSSTIRPASHSDRLLLLPLEGQLRRIVQHEHHSRGCLEAVAGGLEMPREDLRLAHSVIREKALRARPVLAGHRDTFTDPLRKPRHQGLESLPQAHVRKRAPGEFLIDPSCRLRVASDPLSHLPLPHPSTGRVHACPDVLIH